MTEINNVSTNNMDFKRLDTTRDIVITPKNVFGNPVQLNTSHTWTAKVSDETNYVGNYPATINPTRIIVNSADFTKLPAGQYHLEVWEEWTDANGDSQRAIYPSPNETIPFRIYSNITDLAEKEIKTIGFQDVVDQAVMNIGMNYVFKVNTIEPDQTATVVQAAADGKNYVTFNVPRGAKGDPGKPFSIAKVFPSKDALSGDGLSEGDLVMVASNVNDPNNADLYAWTGKEFKLIADLSGAQGIQGPQGTPGPKGADGKTPYFHQAWADSPDGTLGFNPDYRSYVGLDILNLTRWAKNPAMSNSTYTIVSSDDSSFKFNGQGTNLFEVLSKSFPAQVGDKLKFTIHYTNRLAFELFNKYGLHFVVSDEYTESDSLTSKIVLPNAITMPTEYQLEYTATTDNVWMQLNFGGIADSSQVDFDIKIEVENLTNPVKHAYMGTYSDYTATSSTNSSDYSWSLVQGPAGPKGDAAIISIISQADYDALADKSGVYFIEG